MKGRSHCATCNHVLGARDLIPIISYLASGGKCRYCGQKISPRYLITEIICAIVYVAIVAKYGLTLETVELLAFASTLLFLSLTDLDEYIIPNGCTLTALGIRVVYLAICFAQGTMTGNDILYYVGSAFGIGIVLVIVVLVADKVFGRESMGGGDLKLYFIAGLYFGWQQCLFLVIVSCIIGIVAAMAGLRASMADSPDDVDFSKKPGEALAGGKKASPKEGALAENAESAEASSTEAAGDAKAAKVSKKQGSPDSNGSAAPSEPAAQPASSLRRAIPFGPSIAVACIVTMLVGDSFVTWYLGLL